MSVRNCSPVSSSMSRIRARLSARYVRELWKKGK